MVNETGKIISHYKIVDQIGRGGTGIVYKAQDIKLKRPVALKFLTCNFDDFAEEKQRFIQEAKAASALDHPNIYTIYEIGETDEKQLFIAMAFYQGETLQKKLNKGAMEINRVTEIILQIARGLEEAHSKGIIHHDIKPTNIMVTRENKVKLLDFGLAKLLRSNLSAKIGTTVETISYMSPEQTHGGNVDQRTDIWSLGVIFYEMLSGDLPFKGDYGQAIIYSILNEEPEPVCVKRPDIPDEIEKIIKKSLSKKVEERYFSFKEFIRDVEGACSPKDAVSSSISDSKNQNNSIAVLDFTNISGDQTVNWLCSGLAETVNVDLQRIYSLKVISREQLLKIVIPFQGEKIPEEKIIEIGRTIKARWLVWGGFQKFGDAIRITASFTDVFTGEMIGSTKIDGMMDNIFKLQDEIIVALADTLHIILSPAEKRKIKQPETLELEAYEYYIKARHFFYKFERDSYAGAQNLFEKAIAIDSKYALAYSGLGSVYISRFIEDTDVRDLDIGITFLQKALNYDSEIAEAHKWLTYAYTRKEEFDEAVQSGLTAVKLNPDNFLTYYFLGVAYVAGASKDYNSSGYIEGVKHLKHCLSIKTNYEAGHEVIAWVYMLHSEYKEAEIHLRKAIEIEESNSTEGAKFVGAFTLMGNLHFREKEFEKAVKLYEQAIISLENSGHLYSKVYLSQTYIGLGNIALIKKSYDEALRFFKLSYETIEQKPGFLGAGYFLIYTYLGIARTYYKLSRFEDSKKYFNHALVLFENKAGYDFSWIWEACDARVFLEFAKYYGTVNRDADVFNSLKNAVECGYMDLPSLILDEDFIALQNMQKFKSLIQQVEHVNTLFKSGVKN